MESIGVTLPYKISRLLSGSLLCTARSGLAVLQRAPAQRVQVQAAHLAEVATLATTDGSAVDVAITIARGWKRAA